MAFLGPLALTRQTAPYLPPTGGGKSPPQETSNLKATKRSMLQERSQGAILEEALEWPGTHDGDTGRDTGAPSIMGSSFHSDVNQVFQVGASNTSGDSGS